jgi:hypothetical protein
MLFKVPRRRPPQTRHVGKRKQGPYAFMVTFDDLAVHPGFRGVTRTPFPDIPQVAEMEVLGEDARIIKATPPFEGNLLHKGGSVVHTPYDLAFWFDRPYHAVTFEIRCPTDYWFYDVYVFDAKGEEHTGYQWGTLEDAREHILSLNADTLEGSPETFQGFTLSVYSVDHADLDFDFDNLVAI